MKKMHKKPVEKKNGIPVRTNIKAGDFWDDMRSMSSSTYNALTGLTGSLTGSSSSSGTATSSAGTASAS
jgi:hypothetical protein